MRKLISRLLRRRRAPDTATASNAGDDGPRVVDGFLEKCACGTDVDAFLRGPRGGNAQNCQCPRCGDWYNLGWIPGHDRPLFLEYQGPRADLDLRASAPGSESVN